MTKHYALQNQIVKAKLKEAQAELHELKEEKDQENLESWLKLLYKSLKPHEEHIHQI